jgi:hypothetical protein
MKIITSYQNTRFVNAVSSGGALMLAVLGQKKKSLFVVQCYSTHWNTGEPIRRNEMLN